MKRSEAVRYLFLSVFTGVLCIFLAVLIGFGIFYHEYPVYTNVTAYETTQYTKDLKKAELYATDLCVSEDDVTVKGYTADPTLHAAALFDVTNKKVVEGYNLHSVIYPASTTKVLTAYVTLKHGDLDDIVPVSDSITTLPSDAQVCGLQPGDQLSLYDLLSGLLLYSGNDNAIAIAEYISGSVDEFAALMNEEAARLGATNTHFVNPHGLHSDDHYTTPYDLYLIFQACMEYPAFNEITALTSIDVTITRADGTSRTVTWYPTNYYSTGDAVMPENLTHLGGKTGTTDEAGNCLIIHSISEKGNLYISMIMGASDKSIVYEQMNAMLSAGTK